MKKTNILFILMDAVRADYLSCYGYLKKTSPAIDKIADEGTLFERCISVAPWTPPSHASFFTGLFPSQHGVHGEVSENLSLSSDTTTMAELLSENGYHTAAISPTPHISKKRGFNKGYNEFYEMWRNPELPINLLASKIKNKAVGWDHYTSAINYYAKKTFKVSQDMGKPFFLFINYLVAHSPYESPYPYYCKFMSNKQKILYKNRVRVIARKIDTYAHLVNDVSKISEEDFDIIKAAYAGAIAYIDFRISELIDYLKKIGILDETVIIITSDHGENFGEHGLATHQFCLYNTLLHIPLIIRYPEKVPQGLKTSEPVQTTDILPTILDLLDITWEERENLTGVSLFPIKETYHDYLFAGYARPIQDLLNIFKRECPDYNYTELDKGLKMISDKKYKYIENSDGQGELYDWDKDFHEMNNLIEKRPEIAEMLRQKLHKWHDSLYKMIEAPDSCEDDEETKKRLRALGYL